MRGEYKIFFSNDPATGLTIMTPEKVAEGDQAYWIGFPAKHQLIDQFNYGSVVAGMSVPQMLACLTQTIWSDEQGFNNSNGSGWGNYQNKLIKRTDLFALEQKVKRLQFQLAEAKKLIIEAHPLPGGPVSA